jgi:hypothetical protein
MPSSAYLLSLALLSLSPLSLGWRYEDQQPYGPSYPSSYPSSQSYPQASSDDGRYGMRPPPRINAGNGDTGTRPAAWNQAEQPQSQFEYKESESEYGKKTEKLECGKELYVSPNMIIDIRTSLQYGAQLLDGIYSSSFQGCVSACCDYEGCDLALYKSDGFHRLGKPVISCTVACLITVRWSTMSGLRRAFSLVHLIMGRC